MPQDPTLVATFVSRGGWSRGLRRASPMREVVSSKPRRGYTPVSTQVDSGLHPLIRPVANRLVSSHLTVMLDIGKP